jgi:hypothetical protein
VGEHGVRDIEARATDRAVYEAMLAPSRAARDSDAVVTGTPEAYFIDLPLIDENEQPQVGFVAAAQEPWPGPLALYRSPDGTAFTLNAIVSTPAITGVTASGLASGPQGRIDHATVLDVTLDRGALISVTDLQFLGGANVLAVETSADTWELLQFQVASLIAPSTYRLTRLLRAQRGSDDALVPLVPAGARVVLIDAAVMPVAMSRDDTAIAFNWKIGPASRDIGDASYLDVEHRFRGRGLLPLSPVHVRGSRNGAGDIAVTWIRRTRLGGDNWESLEVPLGEDSERYEIDVLDGTVVKRTLAASSPAVTYSAADQIADFGATQATLALRVVQVSPSSGRGVGRLATV